MSFRIEIAADIGGYGALVSVFTRFPVNPGTTDEHIIAWLKSELPLFREKIRHSEAFIDDEEAS